MKKHLIGSALFISIVSLFVVGFSFFRLVPIPNLPPVDVPAQPKLTPTWNLGRSVPIGNPRAIADRKAGQITIYVNTIPGTLDTDAEIEASFTFYAVEGRGLRILDVVHDSLVNTVVKDNDTKWILRYHAEWIKELPTDANLYVVPGAADDSAFTARDAIPVLVRGWN